ncbi:MAG: PAS domain S-box protein [Chloroflexi bacterium]|nr:MAG: PAS domain S-box protein [Chloroflexota bacterium]
MDIICFVGLNDPEKRSLTVTYTSIAPKIQSLTKTMTGKEIVGFQLTPENWPLYVQVIEERQPIFRDNLKPVLFKMVPDVPQTIIKQILKLLGIKGDASVIHLPLQVEGQVFGALLHNSKAIFEADLSVLSIFASQVAAALKNARLLDRVSKSEAKFRRLFELAPDVIVIVDKNGNVFPVEVSLSPLEANGETLILSTIRDITWRKNRKRELELLNQVMMSAAVSKNQEDLFNAGCEAVARFFAVPRLHWLC